MKENLIFGIYPGGATGTDNSPELATGKPDKPASIIKALDTLQGESKHFLVRCYLGYFGNGIHKNLTPSDPVQYVKLSRKLDLVLGYHSASMDMEGWTTFIKSQIVQYGEHLAKIQITEEPNLHGIPAVDGDIPHVRKALVNGIVAAKQEIKRLNLPIEVGFNAVVNFASDYDFWREIKSLSSPAFDHALDYVGLDFFPDVFHPVPLEKLPDAVIAVLNHFRNTNLREAGISAKTPIHITENGWPTSPDRSEEKQAAVLEVIIRTIHKERENFNVTTYELFDLRDVDSQNPDIFYQFGIMRDDYSPKLAFNLYQKLIAEIGR